MASEKRYWAVGQDRTDLNDTKGTPTVFHYSEGSWQRLDTGVAYGTFFTIEGTSDDDVWFGGTHAYSDTVQWRHADGPLVVHWDGSSFTEIEGNWGALGIDNSETGYVTDIKIDGTDVYFLICAALNASGHLLKYDTTTTTWSKILAYNQCAAITFGTCTHLDAFQFEKYGSNYYINGWFVFDGFFNWKYSGSVPAPYQHGGPIYDAVEQIGMHSRAENNTIAVYNKTGSAPYEMVVTRNFFDPAATASYEYTGSFSKGSGEHLVPHPSCYQDSSGKVYISGVESDSGKVSVLSLSSDNSTWELTNFTTANADALQAPIINSYDDSEIMLLYSDPDNSDNLKSIKYNGSTWGSAELLETSSWRPLGLFATVGTTGDSPIVCNSPLIAEKDHELGHFKCLPPQHRDPDGYRKYTVPFVFGVPGIKIRKD